MIQRAEVAAASSIPRANDFASGASTHGNAARSSMPLAFSPSSAPLSSRRRISGGVCTGRASCSRSVQSRTPCPAAVRPARPSRCCAEARLIFSISSVLMPRCGSKRATRASPLIDHRAHAVDRERRFRHVGRDDDLALRPRRDGRVLLRGGQFAVQRVQGKAARGRAVRAARSASAKSRKRPA